MEIRILGSGTGEPSLKRGAPGLIVKIGKETILFDSGSGTLNRMIQARVDYLNLDYIFYSHFHPDHIAELVPILFAFKYNSKPRTKNIKIIGPKGAVNLYYGLLKVHGEWITPDKFSVEIIELNGKPYNGDGWTVKSAQLDHTDPCVGYRIEEIKNTVTKSVVYSGDTDYCRGIVELSKNADLFISECSFPEKYKIKGHLTPRLAGKIAKESGCKYLVLTHLYPVCDKYNIRAECRKVYKGKLTIAKDLMKFEV